MWKPQEIIVHKNVIDDPVTQYILSQCSGVPVKYVDKGTQEAVKNASDILKNTNSGMLDQIIAGKKILYIAPAGTAVDVFEMPDDRFVCPEFDRLKLASNGCFYQCDWCYLKLTYRAAFPYITVRTEYEDIKEQIDKALNEKQGDVIFNSGELADSLALEHLTGAAKEFIPYFAQTQNGHLFMLTKSDNVDGILDLEHNGRTKIAWSMNAPAISRNYEIGAPPFDRRLAAAKKVQDAGYPLRLRLDPIVPVEGWKDMYADTIRTIFNKVSPERMTLGTLRFEPGFYRMRDTIFTSGPDLPRMIDEMSPMFEPKVFQEGKRPKSGKYSFSEARRAEIFQFVIDEIRKHSDCRIALCKESASVWDSVGLTYENCECVCQM